MWTPASGSVTYASGFSGLGNIVQDRNGYIVATDRVGNLVYRIDKQGKATIIAGTGASSGGGDGSPALSTAFYGVRGVWFLDDNTYFLATHEGSQVWYIDRDGISRLFIDGRDNDGSHSGDNDNYRTPGLKISEARAVTVDYQGNVLVTENDRGFIRRIEKSNVAVYTQPTAWTVKPVVVRSNGRRINLSFSVLSSLQNIVAQVVDCHGRAISLPMTISISADVHTITWQSASLPTGYYMACVRMAGFSSSVPFCVVR
jgi:hypothetical protein